MENNKGNKLKKANQLFDRFIYLPVFKIGLFIGAASARLGWNSFTRRFMRINAKMVLLIRRGRCQQDIISVAREWKRMFPDPDMQKIISSDENTVYAETHSYCPLRDSGDAQACYKVMEFDRCMLERIGGQFIVLQSQAEPGEKICRIAIRSLNNPVDDLVPAHERGGK